MKLEYKCEKCGEWHKNRNIFYHLQEKRRITKKEVNDIGLNGFGSIYAFATYCPVKKEYATCNGFF